MASTQLTCVFVLLLFVVISTEYSLKTYRAAVVDYEPFFQILWKPADIVLENAKRYAEYATKAAQQKAIIVVFPEYGMTGTQAVSIARIIALPFTQTVPDPKHISWNPCLNSTEFAPTEAMRVLSCSARNNSIAILANLISREDCKKENDPNCPSDGHYLYNTNVVFDKTGKLIARYHKKHLFYEGPVVDSPKQAEHEIFKIEEIEFATFTGFDIIYKDPPVELVRTNKIKNIICPAAWINMMPFLLGPQLYSGMARGLGVNLIASGYNKPIYARLGTGIYSSQLGALNESFDISSEGRLLTADLPIDPSSVPEESQCLPPIKSQSVTPNHALIHFYKLFTLTNKPSSSPVLPTNLIIYKSLIDFAAHYLKESHGDVTLCQKGACCNLVYNLTRNHDLGVYALMAFDGIHDFFKFGFGLQTCSVMRCENEYDIESCGRVPTTTPRAIFHELSLTAQLEADVVFPSVVKGDLQLLPAKDWSFSLRNCEGNSSQSKIELTKATESILIASLFARKYDRDTN